MRYSGNNSRIPVSGKLLLFFLTGFAAGVLFVCFLGRNYLDYAGILSEYYLNRYKYMELVKEQLFFYLLKERLSPVLLLFVLSLTMFGRAAFHLFFCWQGFSFGTLFTLSVFRFGGKGLLLCVAGILPQYLLYVPAVLMLYSAGGREGIPVSGRSRRMGGKTGIVGDALQYLLLFLLLVAGIFLEAWVNPELVQQLLKFL